MTLRNSAVRILRPAIFVFLLPGLLFRASAQQPPPAAVTLQDYISQLDRCSATLSSSANDPSAIHNLRMSLPNQWTITSANQSYSVSAEWLSAGLARVETAKRRGIELKRIQDQIAAHSEAAQELVKATPQRNLSESSAKLNAILSAKEFQAIHGPTWFETLWGRIWSWIDRQWEKLFGHLGHPRAIGNVIAWTVIAITTLLLLLWVVRATTRISSGPEMDLRGANAAGQDSAYWQRKARESAGRGDYRSAIHAAYWAAIARMEEAKLLTENRSRTPRESLSLVRRESAEYPPLLQLTRRFELVWYGYRAADSTDWSDAVKQLETLGCLRPSTPAISAS